MENVVNYVLIGIVVLMLIALPIMMNSKNKKETQKIQEQTNSLKVGDKVLTTSGVYGTITELKFDETQKLVVIETGGKEKSYLTVDAYAIYTVFKSEEELNRTLDFRQMLALVKGQAGEKLYDEEHFEIPENWEKQHVDVLINFSDAIRNGAELVAPGSEGIKAVEIADSMYLSDWLGKEVALPVDDDLFYSELQKRVEEEKAGRK